MSPDSSLGVRGQAVLQSTVDKYPQRLYRAAGHGSFNNNSQACERIVNNRTGLACNDNFVLVGLFVQPIELKLHTSPYQSDHQHPEADLHQEAEAACHVCRIYKQL